MRRYQEEATPAEDQPEVSEGFAYSICSTNTTQQDWMISVYLLVWNSSHHISDSKTFGKSAVTPVGLDWDANPCEEKVH